MRKNKIYIGLGSNIDPEKNLRAAAGLLRTEWPAIRFSSIYKTAPRDRTDQPDFLNAVAAFETNESAETISSKLRSIEANLKKDVRERFGPRTIDLDLLLYGTEVLPGRREWKKAAETTNDKLPTTNSLIIPHPRMHERRFVLEPLRELIDPEALHPVFGASWSELRERTSNQRCERTDMGV